MKTMAEVVQLQRAEEQVNPEQNGPKVRLAWEFRMAERTVVRGRAQPLRFIGVRLPQSVHDALAAHGMPAAVARQVLVMWAEKLRR
jgi:hypothetical protein